MHGLSSSAVMKSHKQTNKQTKKQVAFGRPFISNPDLPLRFAKNLPLAPDAPVSSWYGGGGAEGYTDFPTAATTTTGEDDDDGGVSKL